MKIIPIFIPHSGCPYKCVYCDQHKISGTTGSPSVDKVRSIINRNLKTIRSGERVEVAFFGGTFTFLPDELQERYLDAVYPYIKKRIIKGLRMSTHPEAVSPETMRRFKKKGGCLVELGIQSLDKGVLKKIKRAVTFKTVRRAADCVKKSGLRLGVQVMLGLPGDTIEKSIATAKKLVRLKPETARIYPTLVIKGTELAAQYKKGRYRSLVMEKAVDQASKIADIFEDVGVKVIRIGLHPSRDLDSKKTVLAGPYHAAFGEMVRARQIRNKIIKAIRSRHVPNRSRIEIRAPEKKLSLISGHRGSEKRFLENYFGVCITLSGASSRIAEIKDVRKDIAIIDPRMPKKAKEKLVKLNFFIAEVPLHKRLYKPVQGHADMMLFRHKDKVVYEPGLEKIAELLRMNGYRCVKGEAIKSGRYPKDIIYNAAAIDNYIIHYKGRIDHNIKALKAHHIPVNQGCAKCSVIPVNNRHIITSDKGIKAAWEKMGGIALLVRPGHIKLPGYKTGFIGGATGVNNRVVIFVGRLDTHPDSQKIKDFIKKSGKGIIELYNGPLYDVGTVLILPCLSENGVLY
ncbi:MAG: radical SAM protein [Candidatus Omnitrophica bacterium]|nr:radical SAM protein [Candidatus Omnitrophota bacterium]